MTRIERVQKMLERLPAEVTYDEILYRVSVMRDVEIGLEQAARGEGIEHDEFFAQLEAEDEEAKNHLDASGEAKPKRRSSVHSKRGATNGGRVRKASEKARREA